MGFGMVGNALPMRRPASRMIPFPCGCQATPPRPASMARKGGSLYNENDCTCISADLERNIHQGIALQPALRTLEGGQQIIADRRTCGPRISRQAAARLWRFDPASAPVKVGLARNRGPFCLEHRNAASQAHFFARQAAAGLFSRRSCRNAALRARGAELTFSLLFDIQGCNF